jgi:phage shock protein A
MSSIFAKGRVLALATVHSLLDQAIDLSSIPVMRQYIRELEEARENMEGQLVETRRNLARATNKREQMQTEINELTGQARLLKAQGKMESALSLAGRLDSLETSLKTDTTSSLQATVTNLEKVVVSLKAKHTKMKDDLDRLAGLDAQAKSAEQAAASIKQAAGALETGSIDNLAEKIENRAAKAAGKLDAAMGTLDPNADVERAKAEARLAAL